MRQPNEVTVDQKMDALDVERSGDALYHAWRDRLVLTPLTDSAATLTVSDAYAIQKRFVDRRLQDGETIVGKKIGVTSKPVQEMLGFDQPDFGQLTSGMLCTEEFGVDLDLLIQPKAEAELAFILKRDLIGPGVTAADVVRATDYVSPCMEIVDSRIRDWQIRIQDTIADNASCGVFLIGEAKVDLRRVDVTLAGLLLHRNGELHSCSVGAAVQQSPTNAVVWLANTLGRLGVPLLAGETILSGSQSPLVNLQDGDELVCTISQIGCCRVRFHRGSSR